MRTFLLAGMLLLASTFTANAEDRRIRLVNNSSLDIVEFHASNTGRSTFEEDILGQEVLRPGQAVIINLDDGSGYCKFDFLTVMGNGSRITKRNVNVCELETYTITD